MAVIGIDLGTTNSLGCVYRNGKAELIPNAYGSYLTPSVVSMTEDGKLIVGQPAKDRLITHPERTVSSFKKDMGTGRSWKPGEKSFLPEELSSLVIRSIVEDAQNYLGEEIEEAVISVPAYFHDEQRVAVKRAGALAGIHVERIVNEPSAAALASYFTANEEQNMLVFDFGGGTLDVSLVDCFDTMVEIVSVAGNNRLGGDDFDDRLTDYLLAEFKASDHIDLSHDEAAVQRVREGAEKAKIELSSSTSTTVNLPFLTMVKDMPHHMEVTVTRAKFDELTHDLVDRTAGPVQNALRDAGITARDLSKVLLVGGSTRIPAVQDKVRRMLGMEPSKGINPDECVAMGAAIQAGKLSGSLPENSAASSIILMDVTPLSLSIETVGGIATHLIERNTTIPARHSQIFTTAANFQTSVDIKVYQGERQFVKDNTLLGNFKLSGIKRAMAGVPQIEVTFDIDVNGILTVAAKDMGTGKAQQITITSRSNLSEEEIQQAVREAEMYEQEDGERKGYYELHSESEVLIAKTEQALKKAGKQLDRSEKHQIKSAMNQLKKSVVKMKPMKMQENDAHQLQSEKEILENLTARLFSLAESDENR